MKKGLALMGALLLSFLLLASCTQGNEKEEWIVGFWATEATYTPHTSVVEFSADGTYSIYDNYACSGAPTVSGTWSLQGDVLASDGNSYTITKVSDDEWIEPTGHTLYRKGTEPEGSIFEQPETALTVGNWSDGDLPIQHTKKLYSFTSASAGNYAVSWEDSSDGGSYTGDINVSAYKSDQPTEIFYDHNGLTPPQTVALAASKKIFIIVEASFSGGTYRIKVQ